MRLPALITSDLHLTANPKDEYRWRLFDFLEDQCRAEQVKTLCILGDLTDAKDYHPSSLTNRVVAQISRMRAVVERVIILCGNHDYLRAGHAYFEFLNYIPGVTFVVKPYEDLMDDGVATLWLPHTKTPAKDWEGIDTTHFDYVFMHQTVGGSVASNGQKMDGEDVPDMSAWGKVYSGDIHVPQVIKGVEYVGSPYHVHFGDAFTPRCILLDRRNRPVDVHMESISRRTLTVKSLRELKRIELAAGDQVKVRIELDEADKHDWQRIKRLAAEYVKAEGAELHGLELRVQKAQVYIGSSDKVGFASTDPDAVTRFAEMQELGGDALDEALEIVK